MAHLVVIGGLLGILVRAEVEVEELLEKGEERLIEGELECLDLDFGFSFDEEGEFIVDYGYTYLVVILVLVRQMQQEPLSAMSADGFLQQQFLNREAYLGPLFYLVVLLVVKGQLVPGEDGVLDEQLEVVALGLLALPLPLDLYPA